MPSQFDQLRVRFEQMTTAQKGDFIGKLKAMQNRSPEHMRFITECEYKYRRENGGGSQVEDSFDRQTSGSTVHTQTRKLPTKVIAAVIAAVLVVGGGVFAFSNLNIGETDFLMERILAHAARR